MTGKITLILGPMFGSKTSLLINNAKRYKLAKKNVVLIKYNKDDRYSVDSVCTHDKLFIKATFSCDNLKNLMDNSELMNADVILIDEAQFMGHIVEFSDKFASLGKIVVLAALNGNFKREEFNQVSQLVPKADEIIHLKAICTMCGNDAAFTKRMNDDTSIEIIGGENMYESRCRSCFDK